VRMGRFGPFVQMGTKDDEEKPRFAGLRPGQKMDKITLADAMVLFQLPRALGHTTQGEPVQANVGRFGPYIKYGTKYVSIKEDDPYTIELPRALVLIEQKKQADANRIILDFPDAGIQVLNGRYGPYITDKQRNAKIPKDRDPKKLTVDECRELLAQAPVRRGRGRFGKKTAMAAAATPTPAAPTPPAAATPKRTAAAAADIKTARRARSVAKASAKSKPQPARKKKSTPKRASARKVG
jgi:DNA topoisomerase I